MITKKSFSKQKLVGLDTTEWIWYIWAVAPKELAETFARYGVILSSEADVNALAAYSEDGTDISGTLVKNGIPFSYNTKEILNAVPIPCDKLNSSNLTYY